LSLGGGKTAAATGICSSLGQKGGEKKRLCRKFQLGKKTFLRGTQKKKGRRVGRCPRVVPIFRTWFRGGGFGPGKGVKGVIVPTKGKTSGGLGFFLLTKKGGGREKQGGEKTSRRRGGGGWPPLAGSSTFAHWGKGTFGRGEEREWSNRRSGGKKASLLLVRIKKNTFGEKSRGERKKGAFRQGRRKGGGRAVDAVGFGEKQNADASFGKGGDRVVGLGGEG